MKIITHEDIINLDIDYKELYSWIKDSFIQKNSAILPNKISITGEGGKFFNTMPSVSTVNDVFGVKVVTRKQDRKPTIDSQIYLYDLESYNIKSVMDGNYITAMRTACVSTLAIEKLAVKNFETISFMGLGLVSVTTLKIIEKIFEGRKLTIKLLKYKNQAEELIEKFKENNNFNFVISNSVEELINGSDVVISAITYADGYISEFDWYKEGVLLLPVHVKGFSNVDKLFDKVYMDDFDNMKVIEGFDLIKNKCELTDLLLDETKGRKDDKEKIISYNVGLSTHDILFANNIYKKVNEKGNIEEVKLNQINEKIWI